MSFEIFYFCIYGHIKLEVKGCEEEQQKNKQKNTVILDCAGLFAGLRHYKIWNC